MPVIQKVTVLSENQRSVVHIFSSWHTGVMQVKFTSTLNCNTVYLLKIQICAVLALQSKVDI